MFNINDYFCKIYILNLDKHVDKWERLEKKMKKLGITNYVRFSAVNGYVEPHKSEWEKYSKEPYDNIEKKLNRKKIGSPGVLGNLKSLIRILEDAKKNKYKKILLFEDDVIFHKKFNSSFKNKLSLSPNKWKLLYLGSNDPSYPKKKNISYKNYYYANSSVQGGFSIGIDHSIYNELIREALKKNNPFDSGPLRYIIRKYPKECIVITPNIVICDVSESSLRNKRDMKIFSKNVGWNLNLFDI